MKNFIISCVFLLFAFLASANANTTTSTTCTVNDLGDETCVTTTTTVTGSGEQTTTGNVLNNSTFGTGTTTSTSGWSTDGDGIHTHGVGDYGQKYDGYVDQGGTLAFHGHEDDNVYQDVDLVGDGHLTQSQINEGFTSTMSADVWFWNNVANTTTLKQTITASDGTVTTQTRNINDHDPNRTWNSGSYVNYTDSYTHNSNTQTDFTIRAEVYNETAGTSYDSGHYGPDVDNVQLSITTAGSQQTSTSTSSVTTLCQDRVPNACTYDQEAVEEAVTVDLSADTGQTYDDYVEEAVQEIDAVEIVSIETSIIVEDDLGVETEMTVEEFVTDTFTSILEENGMQEEFTEALEEEGITEQEFFSAVADEMEAEFSSEVTQEESTEVIEEDAPVEETPAESESVNTSEESVESETSTSSETSEPNTQEATSESEGTGSETESEGTTETESSQQEESTGDDQESVEDGGEAGQDEQEGDQNEGSGEVEVEEQGVSKELEKKIARVIKKLETKLKNLDQKLKAINIVTAQVMIEQQPDMTAYKQMQFYDTRKMPDNPDWYAEDTLLDAYGRSIYQDKTLIAYQTNDPMFMQEQELNRVNNNISRLEAELEVLRNENNR